MNSEHVVSRKDCILVTGANGFIGAKVVRTLLDYGFCNLHCFVRPSSDLARLENIVRRFGAGRNIELVAGDLLSPEDCRKAAQGASIIYHLAAGFDKSFAGAFMNSALATRNLIDGFLEVGTPQRLVNVSSFAVYSNLKLPHGTLLDESCPLEDSPQERFDAYGFGKLKQEKLVREYGTKHKLPYVIVRPGYVFGPGKQELNGRVGINTFGVFIQVGGSNLLPLTFVDNCAEAIVLAGLVAGVEGETFNIVDDELPTSFEFLTSIKEVKRFRSIRIPYVVAYAASAAWERYSTWSKGQLPPVFNRRRCAADWKSHQYSNKKLKDRVGWKPRVRMNDALKAFLAQFSAESSNN